MSRTWYRHKLIRLIACFIFAFVIAAAFSAEPSFAVSKSAFKKSVVTITKVTSVNYNTVKVTWKTVSGAESYVVYRSTEKNKNYKKALVVKNGSAKTAEVSKCVTGQKYFFKVRAQKKFSGTTVQTKEGTPVAGKAKLAKPGISLKTITRTIRVSIGKVDGATSYKIFRSKKKNSGYTCIKTLSAKKDEYFDEGLALNTKYFYKVKAIRKVSGKQLGASTSKVVYAVTPSQDGNAKKYDVSKLEPLEDSPFMNKRIYYLGSSVTAGAYSESQSFVDFLNKRHQMIGDKFAVSGTTMIDRNERSYVSRLNQIPLTGESLDCFVCQLSANDARVGAVIGEPIGPKSNLKKYDTMTVAGAIEYITAYASKNFDCPVVFYTLPAFVSSYYHEDIYLEMRAALLSAAELWDGKLLVLDLWNDPTFDYDANHEYRGLYMVDAIHPTKAGYELKYMPAFELFYEQFFLGDLGKTEAEDEPEYTTDNMSDDEIWIEENDEDPGDYSGI